ncbi:MAG TPA: glycine oxidase ThiO [Ktedonobacteraceae bacterium]|nr:glycine oxidase ThiO [Ktedonobacteraceae bacterium]
MSFEAKADVVIIGAGVIGSAIACFLSRAGLEVLVIERAEIAAESSGAAAGLLAPLGALDGPGAFTDLVMTSRALMLKLLPELEEISGEQAEYLRCGSLRVAMDEAGLESLHERMSIWETLGWEVSWLEGDEARTREAGLAETVRGAVYAPQEGSIRAASLTRVYAGAARQFGARFLEHTEVTGIERAGSRVTGVSLANGTSISCAHLVVACGAWSASIGTLLNLDIPVQPARGQILALKPPMLPLKHILFGPQVYLVPKQDNTIFVGATVEQVGFDKQVTASGIAWLLASAIDLVPELADAPIVRMWAGLRPWSADALPILGRAPGWNNVVLATGHSGVGFETSAITAQSIAELLLNGQEPLLMRSYGLERFG